MQKTDFTNPRVLHKGTEKVKSYYIPFADEENAKANRKAFSPYYLLLNGNWDFTYYERFYDVPKD
ncbi:MAG: hypothetical protein IJN39_05410, partial [Clostridia bacterium]|nr:hypothetical protein [Clostridia bacterium]